MDHRRITTRRTLATAITLGLATTLGLVTSPAAHAAVTGGTGQEWIDMSAATGEDILLANKDPQLASSWEHAGYMWLDTDGSAGQTAGDTPVYCLEPSVNVDSTVNAHGGYYSYDWASYDSASPYWQQNRAKVLYLLANSFPSVSRSAMQTATGASIPTSVTDGRLAATVQMVVWDLTAGTGGGRDGLAYDWTTNGSNNASVAVEWKALYQGLWDFAQRAPQPGSDAGASLLFTGSPVTGTPGASLGPIGIQASGVPTVGLSTVGPIAVTDSTGGTITAGTSGSSFRVTTPTSPTSGEGFVVGSGATNVPIPVGSVWDNPTYTTQALITAKNVTGTVSAVTRASWSAQSPVTGPSIATTASDDDATGDKTVELDGSKINDVVTYTGLEPGKTYTVTGRLMTQAGKDTGITASKEFVADATGAGTVTVTFTPTTAQLRPFAGTPLVAFEKVFAGAASTATGMSTPVATHEDLTDAAQTVDVVPTAPVTPPAPTAVPRIVDTNASDDDATGDKLVELDGSRVYDDVTYSGLTPGKTYVAKGRMMTKDSLGNVTPNGVTAQTTFVAPAGGAGTVRVQFTPTMWELRPYTGGHIVLFESLITEAGGTVAEHKDISDWGQTIRVDRPVLTPAGPKAWIRPGAVPMVTRSFQVDTYRPRTAKQATLLASLDDDRRLTYREDRTLWGRSTWQFVTLRVRSDITQADLVDALNKRIKGTANDLTTVSTMRTARRGATHTVVWELGQGATPKHAWGGRNKTAQTFVARS